MPEAPRPAIRYKSDSTRNKPGEKGKSLSWPIDRDIDRWLECCFELRPDTMELVSTLRFSWADWCRTHNRDPGHRLHLGQQLSMRGLPAFRAGARHMGMRAGIRVLPPQARFLSSTLAIWRISGASAKSV
jgi:hypothetical protein